MKSLTFKTKNTMQKQLTQAIKESLSAFKKPQQTQVVYFDVLQSLQNRFPLLDRWKLRSELLWEIDRRKLAKNPWEIDSLLGQALAEVEKISEERLEYELGISNF